MEVISGVASAFAVVSLSVQLLDKIQSFCDFWEKVRGAPRDISDLVQELRLLEAVIKEIDQKENQYGPDPTLRSILENTFTQVEALLAVMAKYQPGASSDGRVLRTWNSFKFSQGQPGNAISALFKRDEDDTGPGTVQSTRVSMGSTHPFASADRLRKAQQHLHGQVMTALTEGFSKTNFHQASGTVATELDETLDVESHLATLKSEMCRVTAGVPQSWMQSGMQIAIDKAVRGLSDKLNVGSADAERQGKGPEQRGRTTSTEASGSLEADVEKTKDFLHLRGSSRKRRARHFGPLFHGSYASITPSLFGTIYLSTNKFYVYDSTIFEGADYNSNTAASEIETQFTFYPASWLAWWGLNFGVHVVLHREGTAWKNSLQTFQAVPDDSLIFEFCEQGNVMAVNSLLVSGRASPRDTNSKGWTPLHVSLRSP
jgi:hypothetical protein